MMLKHHAIISGNQYHYMFLQQNSLHEPSNEKGGRNLLFCRGEKNLTRFILTQITPLYKLLYFNICAIFINIMYKSR